MSIDTGEIAFLNCQCRQCQNDQKQRSALLSGKLVADYTLKKKDVAITMKAKSNIEIDEEIIPIEPLVIPTSNNH